MQLQIGIAAGIQQNLVYQKRGHPIIIISTHSMFYKGQVVLALVLIDEKQKVKILSVLH